MLRYCMLLCLQEQLIMLVIQSASIKRKGDHVRLMFMPRHPYRT